MTKGTKLVTRGWKYLVVGALIAAFAMLLAACGSSGGDTSSAGAATEATSEASAEADSKEPILIGATYGLTGGMSFFDSPHLAGVKLAIEDFNEKGGVDGRELKLVSNDNASDPKRIVTAAKEIVAQEPTLLMVSNSDTTGIPAAKIGNEAGILTFGTSGPTHFGTPVGPLVFNEWYGDPTEAAVLAEFAHEKGWEKVILVEDQALGYTKDMCDLFSKSYSQWYDSSAIVEHVTYDSTNDTSFPSQVSAIRSAAPNADAIVICGLPTGAPTLMKEIRSAGVTIPFLGTGGALDGDYWTKGVPNLGEFYADAVPSSVFSNNPNKEQRELEARYQAEGGEELTSGHIYVGYSAVQLLAKAIELSGGKTDGESLAKALETLKDFPTMAGPTTYTDECHVPTGRTVAVTEIVDGKGRWLKNLRPDPAYIAKPDDAPC